MSWDFETDPEFQKELDWIDLFVKEEVEPLDHVLGFPYEVKNPKRNALVRPLQAEVKQRGKSPGPFFTGAQVQARLQALQTEWDRTGGFDKGSTWVVDLEDGAFTRARFISAP